MDAVPPDERESTPLAESPDAPGDDLVLEKAFSMQCSAVLSIPTRIILLTEVLKKIALLKPPKWFFRTVACIVLAGQVVVRICQGALPSLKK